MNILILLYFDFLNKKNFPYLKIIFYANVFNLIYKIKFEKFEILFSYSINYFRIKKINLILNSSQKDTIKINIQKIL